MKIVNLKNNIQCPYCGNDLRKLDKNEKTEEHVIGRRFIPKGFLENEWNLKIITCKKCNSDKAKLEGGVSLISQISLSTSVLHNDEVKKDMRRKIGKLNPETKKIRGATHPEQNIPVADSFNKINFSGTYGRAKINVDLVGPPQATYSFVNLAKYHVQAFFYLVSNVDNRDINLSRALTEESVYLSEKNIRCCYILQKTDWGNIQANEFIKRAASWELLSNICTAKNYFRFILRKEKNNFFCSM